MNQRVVITGIGIYSTIGLNINEVTESLYQGKSGIRFDPARIDFGYTSGLCGYVPEPKLKGVLGRRIRVGLAEQGAYAYVATEEAMKMAGLDTAYIAEHEIGILYGNDSSSKAVVESIDILRAKKDTSRIGSGSIFQSMNSTVSMNLSVIYKLRGINTTISGACASSSHAIGLASILIGNGMQDAIVCGGAQELNLYAMGSFDGLGAFSSLNDEPEKASRPFDKDRDGLIPSGGAATVILESLESAEKRGAKILAEVMGYGFSSDGSHISQPNVDGPSRAIKMALKQSGLTASEIEYVNAHATSTPVGDANEAQAIHAVFGNKVPVSSTKSITGHEMWMGGASEVVYSLLMMQNGFIAPNINFKNPDEYSALINIVDKVKKIDFSTFLSNSFGFGGTNSSLIIKKFIP